MDQRTPGTMQAPDDMVTAASGASTRATKWVAYAAAVWAFLFAGISFYWAVGGSAGADTIGSAISALALARPWGRRIPRWMLLTGAWGAGIGMMLYGGASLVQHALMQAGVIGIPTGLGPAATRWHLLLWDPWWLLGGILFAVAAWLRSRTT